MICKRRRSRCARSWPKRCSSASTRAHWPRRSPAPVQPVCSSPPTAAVPSTWPSSSPNPASAAWSAKPKPRSPAPGSSRPSSIGSNTPPDRGAGPESSDGKGFRGWWGQGGIHLFDDRDALSAVQTVVVLREREGAFGRPRRGAGDLAGGDSAVGGQLAVGGGDD